MDIRQILAALSIEDRALWSECRTNMRRAFLHAHNETMGIGQWEAQDDAFVDLIDIQLALLFDRAGRLDTVTDIVGFTDGEKISANIESQATRLMKNKLPEAWKN